MSTALDNVLMCIVLLCFLASGGLPTAWTMIKRNPVIVASLVLFSVLALGTFYAHADPRDKMSYLMKYIDLLFVAIFAVFFRDPVARERGLYTLAAAVAITVVASFVLSAGLLPSAPVLIADNVYPVPFKHSLSHGILVAFGAFLFAQFGFHAVSRRARIAWMTAAAVALANIFFLVPARTGIVLFFALALYCGYLRWSWSGILRILAALVLAAALAYATSSRFHDRINLAVSEYAGWTAGTSADSGSSVGTRLEFYSNTLAIIRDHPLFGVGTGGFPAAYEARVAGTHMKPTRNPHNEYLLLTAHLGIAGLVLLLYLFTQQWRLASRLSTPFECKVARGVVITIAIGCFFNSLLLDHTEGLLFAWLTGLLFAGLRPRSDEAVAG